ncbi:hypothetical protein DPMN_174601 [Dreissena polymorpha]|uniref:Uncharacterized protein n=1 Tax=Dreissena polymorpha TaxID=45954 RepID=A0A9D4E503_DREPO|nr:hypothetical protein DPMN_174601 [Dreissena polymorpha]
MRRNGRFRVILGPRRMRRRRNGVSCSHQRGRGDFRQFCGMRSRSLSTADVLSVVKRGIGAVSVKTSGFVIGVRSMGMSKKLLPGEKAGFPEIGRCEYFSQQAFDGIPCYKQYTCGRSCAYLRPRAKGSCACSSITVGGEADFCEYFS